VTVAPSTSAASQWSIARRLISVLTVALAVMWLTAAVVAVAIVSHEINEVFDSALQETAQRLLPLVVHDFDGEGEHDDQRDDNDHGDDNDHDKESSAELIIENLDFGEHEEYLVYQVRDSAGRVLLRSHDAPKAPFPADLQNGHGEVEGWRYFTESYAPAGLFIQVGEPLTHRREVVVETLTWLAAPLGLLIPLVGFTVFWTVRRSLAPVGAVRAALDARGGADLSPIAFDAMPQELAPIVQDVNRLLARLGKVLESERAFAANSAHELRTPVAAALAQTQRLAAELKSQPQLVRTEQIAATLRRLGDLVEKLLQLARAEAGIALSRDAIDVMPALRLVIDEFIRRGDFGARLQFDDGGWQHLSAHIDIDAFAIVLRNLVDNALNHGQAGGKVHVVLDEAGALHVINDGPVVPPERLARLTQRFERAAAAAPGAGLGLAIVETIMAQSGGRLELRSPASGRADGFEAVVWLDLAERPEVQPGA